MKIALFENAGSSQFDMDLQINQVIIVIPDQYILYSEIKRYSCPYVYWVIMMEIGIYVSSVIIKTNLYSSYAEHLPLLLF